MQFTLVVVGTLIGLLPSYRLMIRNQLVYAGEHLCSKDVPPRYLPAGINTQPPRVPRLAITLSSSESVTRSFISMIMGLL